MSIYKLIYLSQSTEDISEETLKSILEASRRNNAAIDVTGLLLYSSGVFIQFLEGPEEMVKKLYAKITADKRHENAMVIASKEDQNRDFQKWSMGFITPNKEEMNSIEDFVAEDKYKAHLNASNSPLLEIMKRIYLRNEERSDI